MRNSFYITRAVYSLLFLFTFSRLSSECIRVGVYDNPPKIFLNSDGKASGIFIDILNYIAEKEEWEIKYVYAPWENCLYNLDNHIIDILPDVAYSDQRSEIYQFNRITVLPSWLQFYTKNGTTLNSYKELDGKQIAVLDGSIQERICTEMAEKLQISLYFQSYTNYSGTIDAVLFNHADALIASRFLSFSKTGMYLEPSSLILDTSTLHYVSLKGYQKEILDIIDGYLIQFYNDPRSIYYESIERWLHKKPHYFIPLYIIYFLISLLFLTAFGGIGIVILKVVVKRRTKELRISNSQLEIALKKIEEDKDRIKNSADEKEALLKELYHRTRNNMSVITSLLSLKAHTYNEQLIIDFVEELEERIMPMSVAHEILYDSNDLVNINLQDYLRSYILKFSSKYATKEKKIDLNINKISHIFLPIDLIMPFGSLLTELLSNSYKHAFTNKDNGEIIIAIFKEDDDIVFKYSDDGVGISSDIDINNISSLGMLMIRDISENQLQGRFSISRGPGFIFQIKFSPIHFRSSLSL